jgi:hypothetical protein
MRKDYTNNLKKLEDKLNDIKITSEKLGFMHLAWMDIKPLIKAIGCDLERLTDVHNFLEENN